MVTNSSNPSLTSGAQSASAPHPAMPTLPSGLGGNGTPPAIPAASGGPGLSSSGIVSSEASFPIPTSGPAKGGIAVNTQAIRAFAANLDLLAKPDSPLSAVINELASIRPETFLPGAFHSAIALQNAVIGSGQLRDQTSELFENMQAIFAELSDSLQRAAKAAERGEDLNNMSSDDYAKYFGMASGTINQLNGGAGGSSSGSPGLPSTSSGDSSGSGSSSGGSSSGGSAGSGGSGGGPSSGSGKSSASGH